MIARQSHNHVIHATPARDAPHAAGRRLLADTDLKLAAIAARCGFAHAAQLCTVFKKTFSLTPTEHRRQCQPWTTPPA